MRQWLAILGVVLAMGAPTASFAAESPWSARRDVSLDTPPRLAWRSVVRGPSIEAARRFAASETEASDEPIYRDAEPPLVNLSAADRALLERGPYTTGEIVGSGLTGTILGFGLGHAAQGRWAETGWLYTVGEIGTVALFGGWALGCSDTETDLGEAYCLGFAILFGAVALGTIKAVESFDVWRHSFRQNRRHRDLLERSGRADRSERIRVTPWVAARENAPISLGFAFRF